MDLIELATLFRTINLYSHHAHNVAEGDTFLQDHAFLAEIYEFADDAYDDLVERHIGTSDVVLDLCDIVKQAYILLEKLDDQYLDKILILLEESVKAIDEMSKSGTLSSGTQNLIQGQADSIEVLIYKLKRRLK